MPKIIAHITPGTPTWLRELSRQFIGETRQGLVDAARTLEEKPGDISRLDWLDESKPNLSHTRRDGWCVISEDGVITAKRFVRDAIDAARALPHVS